MLTSTAVVFAVLLILLAHRPKAAQTQLFPLIRQYGAKKPDGVASVMLVCARLSAACNADCRPDYVRELVLIFFLLCSDGCLRVTPSHVCWYL